MGEYDFDRDDLSTHGGLDGARGGLLLLASGALGALLCVASCAATLVHIEIGKRRTAHADRANDL